MIYLAMVQVYAMLGIFPLADRFSDPCVYPVDSAYIGDLGECASGYEPYVGFCRDDVILQCWSDGVDTL